MILNAYLHLGRYQEAATFAQAMALPERERAWLDARAERPPTVRLDRTTVVPFAEDNFLGDLMPAVEVELNGTHLVAHLDTGGAFIVLALLKYIDFLGTTGMEAARDRLEGLRDRVHLADALHEEFLQRRSSIAMKPTPAE